MTKKKVQSCHNKESFYQGQKKMAVCTQNSFNNICYLGKKRGAKEPAYRRGSTKIWSMAKTFYLQNRFYSNRKWTKTQLECVNAWEPVSKEN